MYEIWRKCLSLLGLCACRRWALGRQRGVVHDVRPVLQESERFFCLFVIFMEETCLRFVSWG